MLAIFLEVSRTANSMLAAGVAVLAIGGLAVKNDFAEASGLEKLVALSNLFFAIPLAIFGAEHLSGAQFIKDLVPAYMPWHLFWAYFVGFALIAAALSIATKIQAQWSALLFGIMMLAFDAMIHIPGALANLHDRIPTTIVFREASFGAGAWCLAGLAMQNWRAQGKSKLVLVGRLIIGVVAIFFGVEHFLHPANVPGVPLEKFTPTWIPGRMILTYLTGLILLVSGLAILLGKKTRMAATYLGAWITLLVVFVYGPILIVQLLDPSTAVKVEGINYFADTLLFAAVILALARATPASD